MSSSDENHVGNGDAVVATKSGERIDTPNPNDVLCGRGGNINSHQGNEQFRSFVEKRKRVYLTARFKREKRLIASSIVNEIRAMDPPGRFLARKGSMKDNSGYWYDIGDEKARDKTSQALRENAPSIRAEIETEINQQRAEMRRQETTVDQPSPSSKPAANDSSYPTLPLGHHPANGHAPVHPGQQHGHPPPPPPPHPLHAYNPTHQSHYTQQYYDYYYHYYGYGAPPPPPPPGYTSSGAPPAGAPPPSPASGYPPAPPPYWHSQSNPNANAAPPMTTSASSHPSMAMSTAAASPPNSTAVGGKGSGTAKDSEIVKKTSNDMNADTVSQHSPHSNAHSVNAAHPSSASIQTQEEEDRRLAMALQQEENARAFEDRNRRFGSDRKSSRSTAYCAPGYRPRLLNDSVDIANGSVGSSPTKKKRPAMSASHFFGPPIPFVRDSSANSNITTNLRANKDTEMDDHFEMDLKQPAIDIKREENIGKSSGDINDDHHHHDFSCSSFSSRGRVQFKDDSDIMSLFGEGDTIIPSSNVNSTGSFSRVRNTFAASNSIKNDNGNHQFNPIDLAPGERSHRHQQRSQQRGGSRREQDNRNQQNNNQESSLLSQVAHHILGNFGVGGSWTESDAAESDKNPLIEQDRSHHHGENIESEVEMDLGQEVIMDVRDESSSMPPPHVRGSGTQIDWPSRAGCHSWIPDAIGYNTESSSHFGHNDNNREQHGNHDSAHHHANDHSLTRQTSYSRTDISPINSMDMDFSRSSHHGGRKRTGINNGGSNGHAHASSIMNVFDRKNDDSIPEELLSQMNRSVLQQSPSWDPVSVGDMSDGNGMDDSLIRVNSHVVKEKLFGVVGKKKAAPSLSSEHQDGNQPHHHHGTHHAQQNHHNQEPFSVQSENVDASREIDMDWD